MARRPHPAAARAYPGAATAAERRARPCTASDVSARLDGGNGAGGHAITYVRFRNTSTAPCVLLGYPIVTVTEPRQPAVAGSDGSFFPTDGTANMTTGQHTLLGLETDTYCPARPGGGGGGPLYHHITIDLPGGGTVTLDDADGLDVTCGLHLTQFSIPLPAQPEPVTPASQLTAALDTPASVDASATLIYVVELTNPTHQPIALTPCPAYIQSAATPTPVKDIEALNCAPAPTITAHHTVRYEMHMPIPADTPAGTLTIFWSLIGPGASATGRAVVAVHAPPSTSHS